MMEPIFGSGSPFTTLSPAYSWFQPPVSFASRMPMSSGPSPFGILPNVTLAPPLPQESSGFGGGTATAAQATMGGQVMGPGPFGVPAAAPVHVVPEIATAQGLLAAVAMRRGQPMGPTNDQEIEEFIYDAFEWLPGSNDVEVRCEGGRVTLTGNVPHKRLKRDVGEIAWTIPAINDVQNNVTITARRRSRGMTREPETQQPAAAGRKQG